MHALLGGHIETTKVAKILGVTGTLQSYDYRSPRILNSKSSVDLSITCLIVLMPSRNASRHQSLL